MRLQMLTKGRVALISFWAPWCEACTSEFQALDRLQSDAVRRGAVVIAVAVGEPRDKVAEYVAAHKLRYPQLVDESFALADALGQRRVPSTLVLGRDGHITYSGGALDRAALAALRGALDAPQARPDGASDVEAEGVMEVSAAP